MDLALTHPAVVTTETRRRAALTLALAVVAGAVTQALFWRTGLGLNFWIWDVGAVACILLVSRGAVRGPAWAVAAACVLLGFFVVRYESGWTLTVAVPSTLALLAALPFVIGMPSSLEDLARVPQRCFVSLRGTRAALRQTARLPAVASEGAPPDLVRGVTRGLLAGVPTAALFTLLLANDHAFARSLGRIRSSLGDGALFAGWTLLTATAYLFAAHLPRAPENASLDPSPAPRPYRVVFTEARAVVARLPVAVVTWAMVVGQVALVFALFVAANLRHLFGGDALVRAPGSLTYAMYLHAGFYEVLVATVLSVCLVLAGHVLVTPRGAHGAAVPGGWVLATLEGTLLLLTAATVASCWQRLGIYQDAYGASHWRVGVAFVELGVLGVVVLTLGKVVMRGWRGHGGAVLAFAAGMAVVASGFDADAYVARKNLDRASAGKPLDVDYLASLSGDARSLLTHPFVLAHPALAARLEASFCAPRGASWRALRGLGRCVK